MQPQPDAQTIDMVVAIIAVGALAIGLLSMLVGRVVAWWDRFVNHFSAVLSNEQAGIAAVEADKPDRQANRPSVFADDLHVERLQLDKTRAALIELLVYNGWGTGEIRSILKGDSTAIGVEVEQARERLGIDPPERKLRVRDERGERVIPLH